MKMFGLASVYLEIIRKPVHLETKSPIAKKNNGGKRIPRYKKQNYLGSQGYSLIKYTFYDSNIRHRFYLMRIFSCRSFVYHSKARFSVLDSLPKAPLNN